MASSSAGSNAKSSRFSTLKVFKLSKKDKDSSLPPPPPPKDPYYLNNRSFVSLVPDSHSMPSTPLSPPFQYQFPRKQNTFPHPSSSSMSLVSSAASAVSYSPDAPHGLTAKKSGFFKTFKRSPRSPSVKSSKMDDTSTQSSSQSCESTDDGISLPWNFQHHLHVDDNLTNLPPSWTTQLADAGLTEDEIAMIQQARRAGARSPASQYLFTDRPSSPAASTQTSASSVLTRPTPRTTSLPRQFSDTSLQNHTPPPVPAITSPSNASLQSSSHTTPSKRRMRNNSGSSLSLSVNSDHHIPAVNLDQTASPAGAVVGAPSTPPTRRFHVTNGLASPPPSYAHSVSPSMQGYLPDRKDRRVFESPPSSPPEAKPPQRAPSNASSIASSKRSSKRRSKRFTALPPRLSLHAHDMSDLSLWSEALISSIPSDLSSSPSSGSGSGSGGAGASTQATAGTNLSPSYSFLSASSPSSSDKGAAGPSTRTPPRIPPVIVNEDYDDETTSRAPGSAPLSATSWAWDNRSQNFSAPALNESQSPILPLIPGTDKPGESDKLSSGWLDDEEDTDRHSYLSAGSSDGRRDSSRSSTSTMSTVTVTATTIVRNASVARRAVANVVDKSKPGSLSSNRSSLPGMGEEDASSGLLPSPTTAEFMGRSRPESLRHPASPLSSIFDSEEGSGSTSSSISQETPTDPDRASTLCYTEELSPDPTRVNFETDSRYPLLRTETFGGVDKEVVHHEEEFDEVESEGGSYEEAQHVNVHSRTSMAISRPTIVISGSKPLASPGPLTSLTSATPVTPAQRYRGWLSEVVRPLEEFIDEPIDPREYYFDLQEIAEGESGSVYAATLGRDNLQKLRLPPLVKAQDSENAAKGVKALVAIKCVTILPSGSEKLLDLERELKLLRGLMHTNVLGLDALYVDLQDDSLWIRMELMERSLADVIGLTAEGLMLQERMMARFASDTLEALQYLHSHDIAHRDVRSDNLLLNSQGFLKLTDFSNAVQVTPDCSTSTDQVGVLYWQAPEVRSGPYDPLKIDVWSLGATVWEMAETEPPFSSASVVEDRWPPLSQPELYSPAFRDFLRACSEPAACRPTAADLAKNSFINNACGRVVIVQVLSQCTAIEKSLQEREEYLPQS